MNPPLVSVVIPALDEAESLPGLLVELDEALRHLDVEILIVDDGSTDATARVANHAARGLSISVRVFRHDRRAGQSTAIWNGAHIARGRWLATLDADGQNDPADLPHLIVAAERELAGGGRPLLVAGWRVHRNDGAVRRLSSRLANRVRRSLLRDGTLDTGCGLKVMDRGDFLRLPYFDHMHRFLPALVRSQGGRFIQIPVRHRPRTAGRSKYGVNNRLWAGLVDLAGVMWLTRRSQLPREAVPVRGPLPWEAVPVRSRLPRGGAPSGNRLPREDNRTRTLRPDRPRDAR